MVRQSAETPRQHRIEPDHEITGWPRGIANIIGNEGCERFSFYGMKAILYVYLTYLLSLEGIAKGLAEREATSVVHTFIAGVYALPMVGALVADRLLGKFATIMLLSLVYCAGHACLAIFEGDFHGFALGLVLISLGSGGIKPCVSAHVGDQFGRGNWFRVEKIYAAFYFIINFGAMFSQLLVPWLAENVGWAVAFGVPGVLMAVATVFFWFGRKVFVHVPARPGGTLGALDVLSGTLLFVSVGLPMFGNDVVPIYGAQSWAVRAIVSLGFVGAGLGVFAFRQKLQPDDGFLSILFYLFRVKVLGRELSPLTVVEPSSEPALDSGDNLRKHAFWAPAVRRFGHEAAEGPVAVLKILTVFIMVSVFWALFDQYGSSWVEQARSMDRGFNLLGWEFTLLPSQVGAVNPVMVMILVPLMSAKGYPLLERTLRVQMTPLNRMTAGMVVASLSFVVVALAQHRLDAGESVHVGWQFLAFFILTLAEVMISVTGLEFAYTQAPKRMKSLLMGFWLFTVAIGNVLVVFLVGFEGLPWVSFFWLFAGLMLIAALIFGLRARSYEYRTYTQ